MSSLVPDSLMGSSSVETEIVAATAAVDIAVDEGQQSDDQDLYDCNREIDKERHERRMARLALRDQLSENGFALRKALKNESIKGYFPSPLEMEEMSIEDIMAEIPAEDLRYVGNIKDWIFMPALFFQTWFSPLSECGGHLSNPIIENCLGAWKLQCLPPFSTNQSWI
jgi:hypothetical protein